MDTPKKTFPDFSVFPVCGASINGKVPKTRKSTKTEKNRSVLIIPNPPPKALCKTPYIRVEKDDVLYVNIYRQEHFEPLKTR